MPEGRKVVTMLKLGELKKQVQMVECGERVPTVKALMRMGSPVVVKEVLGKSVEITVFRNGYVLYMAEGRKTVFPLHDCSGYRYESADQGGMELSDTYFEQENWYIRLVLEGEDRLQKNQDVRIGSKRISYDAVAEDWEVMCRDDEELDYLILKESILKVMEGATPSQKKIFQKYFFEEKTIKQIAEELGISSQAVSVHLKKAVSRMKQMLKKF